MLTFLVKNGKMKLSGKSICWEDAKKLQVKSRHDFNIEGFSKTIKFISRQKLQLRCSESHRSEFQDKCLFVYLLSPETLFCLRWQLNVFRFRFKSAEWARNVVVCSPEVSLRVISLRCQFGLPVWSFGRPKLNRCPGIVGASGNRAPVR